METRQDLICELLSFPENGDETFCLTLRTAKPKAER
jgi:hypothetical protein